MTHYSVGVILTDSVLNVETYVEAVMQRYLEHKDAEPYVCYSLEQAAADIEGKSRRLELILSRKEPGFDYEECGRQLAALRLQTPEQQLAEYLEHHEHFNEEGLPISTNNPDSKWDWYVIGGRWNGWINDLDADTDRPQANIALTEEAIARHKTPHALITPDGVWHERGRMGWFGALITEVADWEQKARSILASYPGHRIVILDAHI